MQGPIKREKPELVFTWTDTVILAIVLVFIEILILWG